MSVGPVLAGGGWVTGLPTEPPGPGPDLPVDGASVLVGELVWPIGFGGDTAEGWSWTGDWSLWSRTSKFGESRWTCL